MAESDQKEQITFDGMRFTKDRSKLLLSAIGLLSAVASLLAAFYFQLQATYHREIAFKEVVRTIPPPRSEDLDKMRSLEKRLSRVESDISQLSNVPTNSRIALDLRDLHSSVIATSNEVRTLDKAILDSPSKALEIPLLRKDMDNLKDSYQSNLASIKEELNRVYSLGEWFVGLMFTMALGIISLAVANFLPRTPQKSQS